MPLQISGYVDPAVYIGEVVVPGAVNIATTPMQIGIIGPGDRTKAISNEAVQRGHVAGETLTVLAQSGTGTGTGISAPVSGVQTLQVTPATLTADVIGLQITVKGDSNPSNNGTFLVTDLTDSAHVKYYNPIGVASAGFTGTWSITPHATLANRSNRMLQNTPVFRNGVSISVNFLAYQPAFVQGTITATRNLTSPNNTMVVSLDGKVGIRIHFVAGSGANSVVQAGGTGSTQFDATLTSALATATIADIAACINLALAAATDSALGVASGLGYGVAYANVASSNAVGLRIQSPLTSPVGDVQITSPIANDMNANSASRVVLAVPARAPSVLTISPLVYVASATYTADYVNPTATEDALLNTGVLAITRVGALAGVGNYTAGVDYTQDGNNINWGGPGAPPPLPPYFPALGVASGANQPYSLAGAATTNAGVTGTTTVFATGIGHFLSSAPDTPTFSAASVGRLLTITGGPNAGTWLIVHFVNNAEVYFAMTGVVLDATARVWTEKAINNTTRLAFDGLGYVDVNLALVNDPTAALANPLVAYSYNLGGNDATLLTASFLATQINAVISANGMYGSRYNAVAKATALLGNTYLQLTSPTVGQAGMVQVLAPPTTVGSANLALFGLAPTQLPVLVIGSGKQPVPGSFYFVSYNITRPTSDYNVQKRFFTLSDATADLGQVTSLNPLMIAVQLAFAQQAPSVVVVQVNDATSPGSPTRLEWDTALAATTNSDVITDVVLLTTDLAVQTDLKDHIENQSSPTEKHYRRGWFGMPFGTLPGDKDTPGTYVYMATRTLQYAPDSPGRGRAILVAPPQLSGVTYTITLPDGSQQTLDSSVLNSTYIAVALAAKKTAFTNPATSLSKKSVTGFNVTDQTNGWKRPERGTMAGQGVMVLSYNAGVFQVLDPVTTEKGGGGLAAFSYDSTSSQKDNVTRKIDQALDANVIGIVPTDLADFILDIKLILVAVLEGEIGATTIAPFKNANGSVRDINPNTDMQVQQDPNDPTKFFFEYWFNLRYPALRLFGQFSVDNPFFSSTGAGQ